ncbi:hypothetical protein JAAARDRAFT_54402 [Jaapia argillacea MUCL 33604]|uniref:Uncharacterized protein n=1 Tax=Jaapia argillacea MUCL 33604 TaxID=933084 RepID=A0A067Q677_9AGAM|nr:hypothetical protein JAAARDRAFT_54402 [Jaapia argillacea MUCL 33604]
MSGIPGHAPQPNLTTKALLLHAEFILSKTYPSLRIDSHLFLSSFVPRENGEPASCSVMGWDDLGYVGKDCLEIWKVWLGHYKPLLGGGGAASKGKGKEKERDMNPEDPPRPPRKRRRVDSDASPSKPKPKPKTRAKAKAKVQIKLEDPSSDSDVPLMELSTRKRALLPHPTKPTTRTNLKEEVHDNVEGTALGTQTTASSSSKPRRGPTKITLIVRPPPTQAIPPPPGFPSNPPGQQVHGSISQAEPLPSERHEPDEPDESMDWEEVEQLLGGEDDVIDDTEPHPPSYNCVREPPTSAPPVPPVSKMCLDDQHLSAGGVDQLRLVVGKLSSSVSARGADHSPLTPQSLSAPVRSHSLIHSSQIKQDTGTHISLMSISSNVFHDDGETTPYTVPAPPRLIPATWGTQPSPTRAPPALPAPTPKAKSKSKAKAKALPSLTTTVPLPRTRTRKPKQTETSSPAFLLPFSLDSLNELLHQLTTIHPPPLTPFPFPPPNSQSWLHISHTLQTQLSLPTSSQTPELIVTCLRDLWANIPTEEHAKDLVYYHRAFVLRELIVVKAKMWGWLWDVVQGAVEDVASKFELKAQYARNAGEYPRNGAAERVPPEWVMKLTRRVLHMCYARQTPLPVLSIRQFLPGARDEGRVFRWEDDLDVPNVRVREDLRGLVLNVLITFLGYPSDVGVKMEDETFPRAWYVEEMCRFVSPDVFLLDRVREDLDGFKGRVLGRYRGRVLGKVVTRRNVGDAVGVLGGHPVRVQTSEERRVLEGIFKVYRLMVPGFGSAGVGGVVAVNGVGGGAPGPVKVAPA